MKPMAICAAVAAALLTIGPVSAGERAKADVQCRQTDRDLVYDCTIVLIGKTSGKPLTGAEIVIKADMPSMAMAHNVRPVTATAGQMPGHYNATLELAMYGEWALTLDVSGPTRDRVIRKLQFGKAMAHGGRQPGKDDMMHGKGGMKKMKKMEKMKPVD